MRAKEFTWTYAALARGTERWRGISMTDFERRQLDRLKQQLDQQHRDANASAVKSKLNSDRVYSKDRT